VQKLLAGRREVPFPEKKPHQYLIFTMETESTRLIAAAFEAVGVDCVRLMGSRKNRDAAVARFKSGGVNVMLAASSMECAGLHLPEVTRLVLYHHHVSPDVAQQAIGRAQRVGREYSLEVIELLTEWEVNHFRLEDVPGAATATG
jgi:SNF2 family DNA or RNA helicase